MASDIRLKIFAYAFSLWENRCCLTRVRYSKKLAEKCSAAVKSFMFMNDFGNFNEKCTGWKRFYLIADDMGKWYSLKNLYLRL